MKIQPILRKTISPVLLGLLFAALLAACGPNPAFTTAAPSPAVQSKQPTPARSQWDNLLDAGKREGEILVYFNAPTEAREVIPVAFNQKFGIKMDLVSGSAAELITRLNSEYRSGINQADILMVGSSSIWASVEPNGFLLPIEPLMVLPEVKDPQKWRQGKLPFFDKDGQVVAYFSQVIPPVIYNSDLVKQGEITSYLDLLKPQWKGKVVMFDPGIAGAAQFGATTLTVIWDLDRAKEFLNTLLKQQEAVVTRDQRQQMEWVAHGKYQVALWAQTPAVIEFLKVSAPLAAANIKEDKAVSASNGGLAIPTKPPHAKATQVFLNWFLSQEGQTLAVKTMGAPSTRVDVPAEGVADMFIVKPGEKIIVQNEEMALIQNKLVDEWRKIIAGQ